MGKSPSTLSVYGNRRGLKENQKQYLAHQSFKIQTIVSTLEKNKIKKTKNKALKKATIILAVSILVTLFYEIVNNTNIVKNETIWLNFQH